MQRLSLRILRIAIIIIIVILTTQGWTGDFVNLFAVFPNGPVVYSFIGLTQALTGAGEMEVYHAVEGSILAVISILIFVLSFTSGVSRGTRIFSFFGANNP
jgi:hypothetical protein